MTVQELIDRLQQIEDKSVNVIKSDYEFQEYDIIIDARETSVPKTLKMGENNVTKIKAVILI